ncbi:probable beta-D-xylosidase 5 [Aristolochia californica]|uniref:probable beta-D-xylosidase 5 n=1 Tax=Aristolochia californica TaxID=171875 RepID=UPI0035E113C6
MGLDVKTLGFCDKSLSYETRSKDLVDRMTLAEKVLQLGDQAHGVDRLGLPPYNWWSEALHGVSDFGRSTHFDKTVPGATSFPTVILTAASFNESLWKNIGQVVSTEARAMYNLGLAGLTFWSPNINVVRDPRWGRALETPGEDPYVVGRYAVNYVRGLQDVAGHETSANLNARPLKVSSCCKHYTAYDVDAWLGVDRTHFDARVTTQDMQETFQVPFEMCVKDGDVSSVMCSYNRINGVPSCADNRLLSETVRGEWDLHGYIVADCDSLEVMHHDHKWLNDEPEDAVAQTLEAGLDLDCGVYYTNYAFAAVQNGRVRETEVDKALRNLYVVLMRLGFFDGSPGGYDSLGKDDVCAKDHIELAAQAAREGIVLLKNNHSLPWNHQKLKKVAVVGPHANATAAMIGNYAGIPCRYVAPKEGISNFVSIDYQMGCDGVACKNETFIYNAAMAAKHADATVIFAGIDLSVEAESLDRLDLLLPGYQTQLINQVAEASSGPVTLVILSAGGVDISFAKENPKISAILWAGYPGGEGGRAIADVIFGHYNPGGRLPLTWYQSGYVDLLPMTSMPLRPVDELGYPGRTYRFFNGSVVYPFGYGLSYSNFTYSINSARQSLSTQLSSLQHCLSMEYNDDDFFQPCPAVRVDDLTCNSTIDFEVEVSNVGGRSGSHVVLVYAVLPLELKDTPAKSLVGFQRVFVDAGGSSSAKFSVNACKSLKVVTREGYVVLPAGEHTISIGDDDGSVSFPVQVNYE